MSSNITFSINGQEYTFSEDRFGDMFLPKVMSSSSMMISRTKNGVVQVNLPEGMPFDPLLMRALEEHNTQITIERKFNEFKNVMDFLNSTWEEDGINGNLRVLPRFDGALYWESEQGQLGSIVFISDKQALVRPRGDSPNSYIMTMWQGPYEQVKRIMRRGTLECPPGSTVISLSNSKVRGFIYPKGYYLKIHLTAPQYWCVENDLKFVPFQ